MASRALRSALPNNPQRDLSKVYPTENKEDKALPDPPHLRSQLRECNGNQEIKHRSPSKSRLLGAENEDPTSTISKSSSSLKAFLDRDNARSPSKKKENEEGKGLKKSKSSTSLAALLPRSRSPKKEKEKEKQNKDYESRRHEKHHSCVVVGSANPPPIWAQFSTPASTTTTTKISLNDVKTDAVSSSATQREGDSRGSDRGDVSDGSKPTEAGPASPRKSRPRPEFLQSGRSMNSLVGTLSEKFASKPPKSTLNAAEYTSTSAMHKRSHSEVLPNSNAKSQPEVPVGKRGSRVMAAVAAFNGKSKPLPSEPMDNTDAEGLRPEAVATAFEALLEARNVPQNTRDKMRALDVNIKADLVKQDKATSRPGTSGVLTESEAHSSSVCSPKDVDRDCHLDDSRSISGTSESSKKSRPRSLTFTFSKGDLSPSKKQKSGHHKGKSGDLSRPGSSHSSSQVNLSLGISASSSRSEYVALPKPFIDYLQENQDPLTVQVGKIHKLRQLLRNEAVSWIESFLSQRGLTELLALLNRTMAIEWREDHEDSLLHELLLCLKALSTTSSAMEELSKVHSTLFPSLLAMLFDEEKRGPSEYATRTIIINLLSNYLVLSTSLMPADRATTILSYMRDPSPPEEARPPGFITSIYHPRPYRLWSKEINSLTKEVFWIFMHQTNIIPFPEQFSDPEDQATDGISFPSSYRDRHFPREHPPRPAAPYIGGVEWDATNYVTAHLDLLNGLIASLPTREDRNNLRQQLKDSGFEKIMGGFLRTCKEKLYGCVHESLSTWIGAAQEDGWPYQDVREGPPREEMLKSPRKGGAGGCGYVKKKRIGEEAPPKLEGLKFDFNMGREEKKTFGGKDADDWF